MITLATLGGLAAAVCCFMAYHWGRADGFDDGRRFEARRAWKVERERIG